jgi:hypothetical protein
MRLLATVAVVLNVANKTNFVNLFVTLKTPRGGIWLKKTLRHPLTDFEVPPGGLQSGMEALLVSRPQRFEKDSLAGRLQRGEKGIFRPEPSIGQHLEMGAGSLSFCCGNASTYDRGRGDALAAEHQRNTGLAPTSGVQDLAFGVSSDGYKVQRVHREMGVEGDGCGGRDLVDRAPGTQMFCPSHQKEMEGGEGRPDRSDQLGQPELLRPTIFRSSPARSGDVPGCPTSRNDQGIGSRAALTSGNGLAECDIVGLAPSRVRDLAFGANPWRV